MNQISEPMVPPSLLCEAVHDVIGVRFDPDNEEDRHTVAQLVHKLSENPEKVDELAASLVQRGNSDNAAQAASLAALKRARWKMAVRPGTASTDLDEDMPSLAVTSSGWESRALPITPEFTSQPEVIVLVQRQPNSPCLVKPDVLGFDIAGPAAQWDAGSLPKWHEFVESAERHLPLRGLIFNRLKHFLGRKPVAVAETAARNYYVVNLHAGSNDSKAHFLFNGDDVYFVVIQNAEPVRNKVNIGEVDTFSRNFVEAYNGSADDARAALASLRYALR